MPYLVQPERRQHIYHHALPDLMVANSVAPHGEKSSSISSGRGRNVGAARATQIAPERHRVFALWIGQTIAVLDGFAQRRGDVIRTDALQPIRPPSPVDAIPQSTGLDERLIARSARGKFDSIT